MEEEDEVRKKPVKIPSYNEVAESSRRNEPKNPFSPSPTFSQAFSFIRGSEFYTPPPSISKDPQRSTTDTHFARSVIPSRGGYLDAPSSSAPAASASSYSAQNRNAILVSDRQKGNPLLKHIRNVRWVFADVTGDYLTGQNSCALYLSLRYHLLHPDYLYYRIRELEKSLKLRVVLCHVDVEDVIKPLLEVTRTALLHDCTLLCGWSLEECGRYLETLKAYERKPADMIQGQMDADYVSRLSHALTSIRHVNKTDVVTLGSTFGSLSHLMDASMEDLARCPGIGERKVRRVYETFHEPFKRSVHKCRVGVGGDDDDGESVEHQESDARQEDKKKKKNQIVMSALSAAFANYSSRDAKITSTQE